MRYSRQREALIELLCSTTSHPDAEWMYTRLRKQFPNISLGTVYRNLRQLADNGEILEVEKNGISHFDATTSEHYHLLCNKCGGIYDVEKDKIELSVKPVDNFTIDGYSLLLKGLCSNCKD